jgi:hypothetical protein
MSLNVEESLPQITKQNLANKTWNVVKNTKLSLDVFLISMIVGTVLLELIRNKISLGWYIVFGILAVGYVLNLLKSQIWK